LFIRTRLPRPPALLSHLLPPFPNLNLTFNSTTQCDGRGEFLSVGGKCLSYRDASPSLLSLYLPGSLVCFMLPAPPPVHTFTPSPDAVPSRESRAPQAGYVDQASPRSVSFSVFLWDRTRRADHWVCHYRCLTVRNATDRHARSKNQPQELSEGSVAAITANAVLCTLSS